MKVLKRFVQISIVLGIVTLFVNPANNGMVIITSIAVWFGIAWLFNYAQRPDILAPKKNALIYPFGDQAFRIACAELNVSDKYEIITHTHYDSVVDAIALWVSHRHSKRRSKVYYYNKEDKTIYQT